jgi:hypothetical protein
MCKVVIALIALGICLLGRQMALPVESLVSTGVTPIEDSNVIVLPVVAQPPAGPLDSPWVNQLLVRSPEEYQPYRDDGILAPK